MTTQARRARKKEFRRCAAKPIFIFGRSPAGLLQANHKFDSPQTLGSRLWVFRQLSLACGGGISLISYSRPTSAPFHKSADGLPDLSQDELSNDLCHRDAKADVAVQHGDLRWKSRVIHDLAND